MASEWDRCGRVPAFHTAWRACGIESRACMESLLSARIIRVARKSTWWCRERRPRARKPAATLRLMPGDDRQQLIELLHLVEEIVGAGGQAALFDGRQGIVGQYDDQRLQGRRPA